MPGLLRWALPLVLGGFASAGWAADDAAATFNAQIASILQARCTSCHGGATPEAKLDLSGSRSLDQLQRDGLHWFRVWQRVEDGSMPPRDETPLTPAEKQTLAQWVRGDLADMLISQQRATGRTKFRRLTRSEYANTLYDLTGIRPAVGRNLPPDGRVDGYDKVSSALPFSAASAEGYLKIADDALAVLFEAPKKDEEHSSRLWAMDTGQSAGQALELPDGWWVSFNSDTTSGRLTLKTPDGKLKSGSTTYAPGIYRLKIRVYAYQSTQPIPFGIYAGHTSAYPQLLDLLTILEAPPGKPTLLETEVYFRTRTNNDTAPVNDAFRLIPFGLGEQVPKNSLAKNCPGPGLAIQYVDVEGPETPLPAATWLLADFPQTILEAFNRPVTAKSKFSQNELLAAFRGTVLRVGPRIYRRDLTPEEIEAATRRFAARIEEGIAPRTAFLEEMSALLTSPDFLCLHEQPGELNAFALASRLSYFLWNSTPDEELLAVARTGKLRESPMLRAQTERLLNDPKSRRFVQDFTDQWLGLWGIDNTTPDKDLYPEYDDVLKYSSLRETRETFQKMLGENLSVRDLVAPDWALLNGRLARHYGIGGVEGMALRQVQLPADSPFGGIWTQAAPLKVTANGTLTSPVKRGVWVAERLLGISIPPPPPNIEPVDPDTRGAKTLREQLALHSSQGSCRACHAKFDPFGFALESFDVMGQFRLNYRLVDEEVANLPPPQRAKRQRWQAGLPVDCAGVTPNGVSFSGIQELRELLAQSPRQLAVGVTRHLVTYATATPTGPLEARAIDQIVEQSAAEQYGLRSLVHGVVQSELFRLK